MLKADSPPSPGDDRHSTVEPQVVHNDPSLRADGIPRITIAFSQLVLRLRPVRTSPQGPASSITPSSRSTTPWRRFTTLSPSGRGRARLRRTPTPATRSATKRRSARWCGHIRPLSTATTRTPRARSSPCPHGLSTSTGSGPVTFLPFRHPMGCRHSQLRLATGIGTVESSTPLRPHRSLPVRHRRADEWRRTQSCAAGSP